MACGVKQGLVIADKNLGPAVAAEAGLAWRFLGEEGIRLEGFPWTSDVRGGWRRLPKSAWSAEDVGDELRHVAGQPAGGVIRFESDSRVLGIRAGYARIEENRQSPSAATKGFDVYVNGTIFCGNLAPEGASRDFESSLRLPAAVSREHAGIREFAIYLPLQIPMDRIAVGLESGSWVGPARPARRRIVFYGSSITQGFCASRPGLAYPARVCRALDAELVNLGFGGNCRGQLSVARAIASLPMDAFVYDFDHNAVGVEELAGRHGSFLREILVAQPALPVVVLSSPNFHNDPAYFGERKAVIAATCRAARLEGYNVHFLPGDSFWNAGDECTVDRLHPNDDGFARMAGSVTRALASMISQTSQ